MFRAARCRPLPIRSNAEIAQRPISAVIAMIRAPDRFGKASAKAAVRYRYIAGPSDTENSFVHGDRRGIDFVSAHKSRREPSNDRYYRRASANTACRPTDRHNTPCRRLNHRVAAAFGIPPGWTSGARSAGSRHAIAHTRYSTASRTVSVRLFPFIFASLRTAWAVASSVI